MHHIPSFQDLPLNTSIPPEATQKLNIHVIKDDANMELSAREVGGSFDDGAFRKLIGPKAHVRSHLAQNAHEARTNQRRNEQEKQGFEVFTKPVKRIGGKLKGNMDVEITMDLDKVKEKVGVDVVCLLSGDGDFTPAIKAVQEQRIPVWVIAFQHSLSYQLHKQADLSIPVGQDLVRLLPTNPPHRRKTHMANLRHLTTYCENGWNHFHPVPMYFARFVAPYTPKYRCPTCGKTKVFNRPYKGGPIRRVA